MGSSSKKHRKESKKHKRSRSESESSDVRVEKDRDVSKHRHRHHRSRKAEEDPHPKSNSGSPIPMPKTGKSNEERRHKHKHKRHKERHASKETRSRRDDVVVTLDNSDSENSDCVEVPIDVETENAAKRSKKHSEILRNVDEHLEREQRAIREREHRDRELRDRELRDRELRDREKREREKEKDREREFREREYREREHREREVARDREQARERERDRERDREREQYRDQDRYQRDSQQQKFTTSSRREPERRKERSASPIPDSGAGDCLSIEETNKLRLKLGLKPLEVDSGPIKPSTASAEKSSSELKRGGENLSSYKDEWGEFLHKPADNLKDKAEAEKLRDKFKQKKEKRILEEKLKRIRTLGESDDEADDVEKWVNRNKKKEVMRKEADMRAKALEEMDAEFGINELIEKEKIDSRRKAYNDKHLRGLRVDHDMEDFSEGKTVILTLKDKGVLDDDDDALVNVNMMDDEHYRKNVANKKKNPLSYGYDVYEEQYDMLGNPIDRGILEKYNEEIEGANKKKNFVIGENLEERKEQQRKLLEIKTKLAGKRLETLEDTRIQLASDTYTEVEMAKFKKPKKKVKKMRQKLKADDLVPLGAEPMGQHFGRRGRIHGDVDDDVEMVVDESEMKHNIEEEDDLQRVLSKARKLKQKESLIKKTLQIEPAELKLEVKEEPEDEEDQENGFKEAHITLNATAEFCRTLGDIPTYGMAGNRDEDSNDMMDYEVEERVNEVKPEEPEASTGTWNSVNPEDVIRPMEDDISNDIGDVAILDEEPDVGAGVGNALKLALSKGYLEKDDKNRPSNSKLSYLQAKNYSIEDKSSAGDDDKFGRRDRFHSGPIMEFRDKETFKPNVKLEYIDDNGRILNLKEAFRYLSHKFHGKGPGKNKIEKRLKKMEQDGLMKTMSSTDTPLGTLTMLQQKQKETKTPYVILSGGKQAAAVSNTTLSKYK